MGYHIPFEQRRCPQPIYIGFEPRSRARREWNWWALWGFPLSLLGVMSAGVLAPLALFFNAVAMRHRPRRLASAGLTISLIGTAMFIGVIALGVSHAKRERQAREHRADARVNKAKVSETRAILNEVGREFERYRALNQGRLPAWVDANMVAVSFHDAWRTPLRFDAEIDHAVLRSAGPDQEFDTPDDVLLKIEGKAPRSISTEVPVSK